MTPLRVTAHLAGGVSLPEGHVALDGLLAWAVALREQMPPIDVHDGEVPEIPIPVAMEPGGRFHLCSFSEQEFECYETRWVNRRFPLAEAQAFGNAKLRRINIAGGPSKSYRLPLESGHLVGDRMDWWCIGDEDRVRELLTLVPGVGKKRGVGLGRVRQWDVIPCDPWDGFPVVRAGRPLRPLPLDWPGVAVDAEQGYRTMTYPYWQRTREELCLVPS